ncbi:MAG: ATP-dependent helicase HrpB [Bdellovibrio sp. CG10_big_fil_rev_8_21_14_0_10_47_8]|nr:MAG: ATP-dependent helicase HrpB [Bdellovibrio sp. CG10_big_fil_rev_8_21_14_0_10_47_8]
MISLPIDDSLESILSSARKHQNLIVSASPGSGKTTRLPPRLLELTEKKVLVLEPRRIAAIAAAARISEERKWTLGQEVGYQIRFESKLHENTRLIFLTEALLNRKLISDPDLSEVGVVVLDEFHERSLHVDLALGLLKELQQLSRPDLKIVVMSATLQVDPIRRFLENCSVHEVPGQIYPLDHIYLKTSQKRQTGPEFTEALGKQIRQSMALLPSGEHLLVFLPGVGEIDRLQNHLGAWATEQGHVLLALHGSLSLEEQKRVLEPQSRSKIILATNIAESSITIDGVRAVIDSGLQRRASIHPKTGFPQLELVRISKSSATQRAGRAARQAPGKCYHLWSSMDELSMPDQEMPEILRSDLAEALLFLAAQGVRDFHAFSWFEKPTSESLQKAISQLQLLEAIDQFQNLTETGRQMLDLPLPPRLSKIMIEATKQQVPHLGAEIAVLLLERDSLKNRIHNQGQECDLSARLEILRQGRHPSFQRALQSLERKLPRTPARTSTPQDEVKSIRFLLLKAFPDRLCRRRKKADSRGLMIGGRGVALESSSVVQKSDFFISLQLMDGLSSSETKVSWACGLTREEIVEFSDGAVQKESWVEYDPDNKKIVRKTATALKIPNVGTLPLEDVQTSPASSEEVAEHLPGVAAQALNEIQKENELLQKWLQRYEFFCRTHPHEGLNDSQWKTALQQASFGEKSLQNVIDKDLIYFVEAQLDPGLLHQFRSDCPERITVPSGSSLEIDYTGELPSLSVRLQEVFGWSETPKIFSGKVPLTLILLGPHYRPVQVTQDLASFWKTGYVEVRKDLRSRYPKHSWPDDPLTAPAQAKGRRRQ